MPITPIMSASEKNADIYRMLPRFVYEMENEGEKARFLPKIERSFERNGIRFKFEITPAYIPVEGVGDSNFYPGPAEELIENALRMLAVEDNPNFKKDLDAVVFSSADLIKQLEKLAGGKSYSRDRIKHSLAILCSVGFELSDGDRRMSFRSINFLREKEKDGETYFMVGFSALFFDGDELFDICFGNENPNKSGSRNE